MTTDDIINQISEILAEADGEFVEKIANQVLSHRVRYLGDSMFEECPELDIEEILKRD